MIFDVDAVDFVVVLLLGSEAVVAVATAAATFRHIDLQVVGRVVHQFVEIGSAVPFLLVFGLDFYGGRVLVVVIIVIVVVIVVVC